MQFVPDYTQSGLSADRIRANFLEPLRSFDGPGWYHSDRDTALVVPRPPEDDAKPSTVWDSKQPEGTLYDVHVWNSPMSALLVSVLAVAPTRGDGRGKRSSGSFAFGPYQVGDHKLLPIGETVLGLTVTAGFVRNGKYRHLEFVDEIGGEWFCASGFEHLDEVFPRAPDILGKKCRAEPFGSKHKIVME